MERKNTHIKRVPGSDMVLAQWVNIYIYTVLHTYLYKFVGFHLNLLILVSLARFYFHIMTPLLNASPER